MLRTEQIRIADIPEATVDSAIERIIRHTVALMRCDVNHRAETCRLIGTGTLLTVDGASGILTAAHVISQLSEQCSLGVLSSFEGRPERSRYKFHHLILHKIAKGKDDAYGPDIGFIALPIQDISYLKSEKVFYNVNKREQIHGLTPFDTKTGFWLTCGFPGEWEQSRTGDNNETVIKSHGALCGSSSISKEYAAGEYDYLEINVDCSSANPELPSSFGGLSGAGIWQMPLVKNQAGEINPDEFILSGVAFYQSSVQHGWRCLRCHGRKTIYNGVPNYLRGKNRWS